MPGRNSSAGQGRLADDEELREAPGNAPSARSMRRRAWRTLPAARRDSRRRSTNARANASRVERGAPRPARRRRAARAAAASPASRSMRARQRRGVAGRVRQRIAIRLDELRRPAGRAHDHRPAARHRFGDDETERLRLRARVHDDVERAHRRCRALDEAGEATRSAIPSGTRVRRRSSASEYWLPAVSYSGAADDVGANRQRGDRAARSPRRNDVVPLPSPERRDQADPHRSGRRRRAVRRARRDRRRHPPAENSSRSTPL